MLTWRVWSLPLAKRRLIPESELDLFRELVTADEVFDSQNGALKFLNYVPEPIAEPVDLCGMPVAGKMAAPCVRAKGHTGKHMDTLKPKVVKRKMITVRGFAAGNWADFELVIE